MPDAKDDLIALADIPAAIGLLTRLPVRVAAEAASARSHRAPWAYPLAGLAVAVVAAAPVYVAIWAGLPPALGAAIFLALQITMTGALHEDGLADAADGLWGGWTVKRRLEIMKDSRIGSYGTLALALSVLIRWQAIALLLAAGAWGAPIAAAMLSRSAMSVVMSMVPNARRSGLSHQVGRPSGVTAALAVGLALLIGMPLAGIAGVFVSLIFVAMTTVACIAIALRKIKGQTGDILGAVQQMTEITALCTLASLL